MRGERRRHQGTTSSKPARSWNRPLTVLNDIVKRSSYGIVRIGTRIGLRGNNIRGNGWPLLLFPQKMSRLEQPLSHAGWQCTYLTPCSETHLPRREGSWS